MKKNDVLKRKLYGKVIGVWCITTILLCFFWSVCGTFVQEIINEIQYILFRETGGNAFFYVVVIVSSMLPVGVLCLLSFRKQSFVSSAFVLREGVSKLAEHKQLSKEEIDGYADAVFYEELQKLVQIHEIMEENTRKALVNERLKMELLTNVSHDLKTPLTSIMGYCGLLQECELQAEEREYVTQMYQKIQYLNDVLEDVFELSKVSSGAVKLELQELDIIKLLQQTIGEFEDEFQEVGLEFVKQISLSSAKVPLDGVRMHRVFYNLLDNALKYALEKTRVFIYVEEKEKVLEIAFVNTASYHMKFDAERITERLVRGNAARTGEGSGIGLAIAKIYTEACGGKFEVETRGDNFEARMKFKR